MRTSSARVTAVPPTIFSEMSALAVAHRVGQPRAGLPGRRRTRPSVIAAAQSGARGRRQPVRPRHRRTRAAPGDRAPPAAPLRPRARPRHRGRRDDRLHRGDRRGPARARRPGRRGGRAGAVLRLLRRDDRSSPEPYAARSPCAPRTSGSTSDELRAAITPRTRFILLNTPHNPTGTVLTRDELAVRSPTSRSSTTSW